MKTNLVLAIVVLLIVTYLLSEMGMVEMPTTRSHRYTTSEVRCVALTMIVDTKGEPSPHSNEVDAKVIRTILNYAAAFKTDICKIFREQLTLIPVGMTRSTFDRREWYIRRIERVSETEINAAIVRTDEIMSAPDPSWKATHYIRAKRPRTMGNQTPEEIAGIRATMDLVPKKMIKDPKTGKDIPDPIEGVIEFYEPREPQKE